MKKEKSIKKIMLSGLFSLLFIISVGLPLFIPTIAQGATRSFLGADLFPCSGSNPVEGQPADSSNSAKDGECTFADVVSGARGIANVTVQIGLLIAPLIFAYVGWLFLTSGDNPGARKTATKIGKDVAIGLAIMIGAWVGINLILSALVCQSVFSASGFPFDVKGGGSGPGCDASITTAIPAK